MGFVLTLAVVTLLINREVYQPQPSPTTTSTDSRLEAEEAVFAQYAGSASCQKCHQEAFDSWVSSNHGLAERLPSVSVDDAAFSDRQPFSHGGVESHPSIAANRHQITTLGFENQRATYDIARVIGHEPLRQFLVSHEGGRYQAVDAAFDPAEKDWFSVHGQEDRRPGEWGHWTGRGMNWNSMCASCHNTRLRKNYDSVTDTYKTTMAEISVSCEACHGPMKSHLEWQNENPNSQAVDPTIQRFNRAQILDTCGSCHSRRAELTGDFHPGEDYFDHYNLTVPDTSDIFYPDGQVRSENYVFTSFLSSRMHAAGVHCLDCHQPHSTKTILPGNALCMRCHDGSYPNSPKIDPVSHSHHTAESAGNQCVNCHMPQTTYMQRHPRRDHGFTIPDPLMTKHLGIPNACNRCHEDHDVEQVIATSEAWYGDRLDRYTRQRTQWIADARQGLETSREPLIQMILGAETPLWQASAAHLLSQWLDHSEVQRALLSALNNTNAMVRAHATIAIGPLAESQRADLTTVLKSLLEDPRRNVRVNAAWALRHQLNPFSPAGRELDHYLHHISDQPTGQMQLGALALAQENTADALAHYTKAAQWDPNSPPIRHELAIVQSMNGNHQEALKELQAATTLAPNEAEYQYKLALAWNELGDADKTIGALEDAVRLDPMHARAWYNLGLARNGRGDTEGAINALIRGESTAPTDPDIPYARATILYQLGRQFEAKQAARRALTIRSDYAPARQLLDAMLRQVP